MAEQSIRISGRVLERMNRRPIEGLRVEAWDQDMLVDDFVGRAERTDADGRFTIRFEAAYFRGLFGKSHPDLYFRLFDGGRFVQPAQEWGRLGDLYRVDPVRLPWRG